MSTAVIEQNTEAPVFDPAKFMADRNAGKATDKPAEAKPAEAKPEAVKEPEHSESPRLSRSNRRQLNNAIREAAEARGELQAYRKLMEEGKIAAPKPDAPAELIEPKRSDFTSDAEYLRATQKYDKAVEAKTSTGAAAQEEQQKAFRDHLTAMDTKAAEDMKLIPDWEKVAKDAADDDDAPEFVPDEHPNLMAMLARSDVRAFVLYHFAKNPDALESMLDLTKTPEKQISAFHRLEGRLEKEYASLQKAAQASEAEKPKEDREHLAEAEPEKAKPGETAADRDVRKPRPSSEVAARGGSPAPDEPLPGSAAWIAKRNQTQFGR